MASLCKGQDWAPEGRAYLGNSDARPVTSGNLVLTDQKVTSKVAWEEAWVMRRSNPTAARWQTVLEDTVAVAVAQLHSEISQ